MGVHIQVPTTTTARFFRHRSSGQDPSCLIHQSQCKDIPRCHSWHWDDLRSRSTNWMGKKNQPPNNHRLVMVGWGGWLSSVNWANRMHVHVYICTLCICIYKWLFVFHVISKYDYVWNTCRGDMKSYEPKQSTHWWVTNSIAGRWKRPTSGSTVPLWCSQGFSRFLQVSEKSRGSHGGVLGSL